MSSWPEILPPRFVYRFVFGRIFRAFHNKIQVNRTRNSSFLFILKSVSPVEAHTHSEREKMESVEAKAIN